MGSYDWQSRTTFNVRKLTFPQMQELRQLRHTAAAELAATLQQGRAP